MVINTMAGILFLGASIVILMIASGSDPTIDIRNEISKSRLFTFGLTSLVASIALLVQTIIVGIRGKVIN